MGPPVVITSSAVVLKSYAITIGIKKYKSITKKMKEKHDKIVLIAKTELNIIQVLISKALVYLYINHDEFVSVNDELRKYNKMKEEIKNREYDVEYTI